MGDVNREALVAEAERVNAAKHADWGQVVANGGPPCFHLDGNRFCLRAERWAGHSAGSYEGDHAFVSLASLLHADAAKVQELEAALEFQRRGNYSLTSEVLEERKAKVKAEADVTRLTARWEALQPCGDLKAALLGEFKVRCFEPVEDEDGETPEQAYHLIDWTTIKDILAKACAFAELEAQR